MKKIILFSIFLLTFSFSFSSLALAENGLADLGDSKEVKTVDVGSSAGKSNNTATALPNPLGTTDINVFVARIISYVLGFVGTISLLLFVYGGFTWMTSAGSPDKVKKGREIIVWSVIGMAVIFMSYVAVKFVIQGLQGTL